MVNLRLLDSCNEEKRRLFGCLFSLEDMRAYQNRVRRSRPAAVILYCSSNKVSKQGRDAALGI